MRHVDAVDDGADEGGVLGSSNSGDLDGGGSGGGSDASCVARRDGDDGGKDAVTNDKARDEQVCSDTEDVAPRQASTGAPEAGHEVDVRVVDNRSLAQLTVPSSCSKSTTGHLYEGAAVIVSMD